MKLPDMVRMPEEDAWVVELARHRFAKNEKTGTPFFDTEEEARAVAKGTPGAVVRLSIAWQVKQSIDKG